MNFARRSFHARSEYQGTPDTIWAAAAGSRDNSRTSCSDLLADKGTITVTPQSLHCTRVMAAGGKQTGWTAGIGVGVILR